MQNRVREVAFAYMAKKAKSIARELGIKDVPVQFDFRSIV